VQLVGALYYLLSNLTHLGEGDGGFSDGKEDGILQAHTSLSSIKLKID